MTQRLDANLHQQRLESFWQIVEESAPLRSPDYEVHHRITSSSGQGRPKPALPRVDEPTSLRVSVLYRTAGLARAAYRPNETSTNLVLRSEYLPKDSYIQFKSFTQYCDQIRSAENFTSQLHVDNRPSRPPSGQPAEELPIHVLCEHRAFT